jgi:hypothetical protein
MRIARDTERTLWMAVVALLSVCASYTMPPRHDGAIETSASASALASDQAAIESRSPQWPALSARGLAAHPTCVYCGQPATVCHHVWPVHLRPDLELDELNLRAVCDHCHLRCCHLGAWQFYNPCIDADIERYREMKAARPRTIEDAKAFVFRFGNDYQLAP